MDKKGWANARDHYGHSALHKSVMANQGDIMKFLLHHHPEHIEDRDNVSNEENDTYLTNMSGFYEWIYYLVVI